MREQDCGRPLITGRGLPEQVVGLTGIIELMIVHREITAGQADS